MGLTLPARAQTTAPKAPPADEPKPSPTPTPRLESYEDRPVRDVILQKLVPGKPGEASTTAELDEATRQLVFNQLRTRVGGAYQQVLISEDITRINRLGRFRRVETRVQLMADGSVTVYLTLLPQPIIADVQVVGNKLLSDQDIAKEVDLLVSTPVDDWQIARSARRIEELYQKKGYYLARVSWNQQELERNGVVLFEIKEGEKVKVTSIVFEGNASFTPSELKAEIKNSEAWLFDSAPLDEAVVEQDVSSLAKFYKDRGYLDVRVDRLVTPAPNGKEAILRFVIDEGAIYTLRNVTLTYGDLSRQFPTEDAAREYAGPFGSVEKVFNKQRQDVSWIGQPPGAYSLEQVMGLMTIKPGDVFSSNKLDVSIKEVKGAFGKLGYTDVTVERRERRDGKEPKVDVVITVFQGRTFRTGEVIVTGTDITKDKIARRNILLRPDRPLDSDDVEETRLRIARSGIFDRNNVKVQIQQPDPLEPDRRDVLVEVRETNTGSFQIGGSIGSDSGLSARIGVTQRNFDLYDTPDTLSEFFAGRAFRGAGQTFSVDLMPGTQTQNFSVSLSEPYLLESEYSGSASLYYRAADYDEWHEQRIGSSFSVGRRLGERWIASIPVRVENIRLTSIDPTAPTDYFKYEDPSLLTSVGLTLKRQSLDDPYIPSKGSTLALGVTQAGVIGGDYTFSTLSAEWQAFATLNEDFFGRKTVFSLKNKIVYIPQSADSVPVFERFYLGGQSMRGFGYRTISPRGIRHDTGGPSSDPVGGTFLFSLGPELRFPIFRDIVSLVTFMDTGTVNNEPTLDNYRVSAGVGARIYIRELSPVPLAFDLGFPVEKQPGDRKRLFTFFVDLPF